MKAVFHRIDELAYEFALHPLFAWVNDQGTPAGERFSFAPSLLLAAMGARTLHQRHFCYDEADTPVKVAINRYAADRATHPMIFLKDWNTLGMDEEFALSPSEMLHWIHFARPNEVHRRHALVLAELAAAHPEPQLRFAMLEVMAACEHVFCSAMAQAAPTLGGLKYFGQHRLNLEQGHVGDADALFADHTLEGLDKLVAMRLIERVASVLWERADALLAFAQAHEGIPLTALAQLERASVNLQAERNQFVPHPGLRITSRRALPTAVELEHAVIKAQLDDHPLFARLRTSDRRHARLLLETLAASMPMSLLAQRDLMHRVASQCNPVDIVGQALAQMAEVMACQSGAFYQDFVALEVDRVADCRGSALLSELYLGHGTLPAREWFAVVLKTLHSERDPVRRYWVLRALEATNEPLFGALGSLTATVEAVEGLELDYFGDRHPPSHQEALNASHRILGSQPLGSRGTRHALRAIETIRAAAVARHDALLTSLDAALDAATRSAPTLFDFLAAK